MMRSLMKVHGFDGPVSVLLIGREAEWLCSLMVEILIPEYEMEKRLEILPKLFPVSLATDAKSVYDYLASATPASAKDREVALDGLVLQ